MSSVQNVLTSLLAAWCLPRTNMFWPSMFFYQLIHDIFLPITACVHSFVGHCIQSRPADGLVAHQQGFDAVDHGQLLWSVVVSSRGGDYSQGGRRRRRGRCNDNFFFLFWNVLGVQSLQTLKNPRCAVTSRSNYFFLSEFFSRDFKNKLSCDFSFHFRSFLLWMTWIRQPSSKSRQSNKVNNTLLSQKPPALLFIILIFAYGNIRFFYSA